MPRFSLDSDGCYRKQVHINDISYVITLLSDEWESIPHRKINNHISYVIRQMKQGLDTKLKYGKIERTNSFLNKCIECDIQYKTRSGYLKHIKKHHPPQEPSTELAEPVNERTVGPITNITNNNTQNININLPPIRNFNDENPKWLTSDLIMRVIQNIPTAIPNLIKEKHFNDRFPENQNIRLDNKRDIKKRLRVYEEGRWKIQDRPALEFRVIEQVYDVLREFIDMMSEDDDADLDEIDDSLSPIDKRIAHITRRIRASEMRSMRVRRVLRDWEHFDSSIQGDYEKTIEPFKDRIDTFLLDNDLRIEQLRERQSMLMG